MSATTPGRQATLDEAFTADAGGAESSESGATVQEDPQDLPCGHDRVYAESGTCMVCEPAVGNLDDGITGELVRDQWGGRP